MNGNICIIITFSMILWLSACDYTKNYALSDSAADLSLITPAAGFQPQTFKDYLAIEYRNLANYEQNTVFDYRAAKHYAKKIEKLESGQLVGPDNYKGQNLTTAYRAELSLARETLIYSLHIHAIPENRAALAIAQTRYDCWLDQARAFPDDPEMLTCKQQFKDSIAQLHKPEIQELEMYQFERI